MTDFNLEYIRRLETIVLWSETRAPPYFNIKFIESLKEQYKTNKNFTEAQKQSIDRIIEKWKIDDISAPRKAYSKYN